MGSFDGALLSRGLSVSGLRTGIEETDEALVRIRPLEDRSELDNSLLVGDSRATEKRSRARESARFAIVLSKAATAMASKPTGFCIRDELESLLAAVGWMFACTAAIVPLPVVVPGTGPVPVGAPAAAAVVAALAAETESRLTRGRGIVAVGTGVIVVVFEGFAWDSWWWLWSRSDCGREDGVCVPV